MSLSPNPYVWRMALEYVRAARAAGCRVTSIVLHPWVLELVGGPRFMPGFPINVDYGVDGDELWVRYEAPGAGQLTKVVKL